MEGKSNNKGLIILVCILSVLVLSLGGFIVYDKVLSKEEQGNSNIIDNNNNHDKKEQTNNDINIDQSLENNINCSISSIEGTNIYLKNSVNNNGRITSDLYINNEFSSRISYFENLYNECDKIDVEKIDQKYFLIKFANEATMYSDFYLFSNSGKLISDFKEWKENGNYILSVSKDVNGGLIFNYFYNYGSDDVSLSEEYCAINAKPQDIYNIKKYVNITNDKLVIEKTESITWKEVYMCKDVNTVDCGNISDIVCNN